MLKQEKTGKKTKSLDLNENISDNVSKNELLEILKDHEKRLKDVESGLGLQVKNTKLNELGLEEKEELEEDSSEINLKEKESEDSFKIPNFTQTITFLGIVGIVIALISFYFYAVANSWIGKTGQITIGLLLGFLLLFFAFFLREKRKVWSNIVFAGAYFVQNLSIGIAVLHFKIMSPIFGLFFCALMIFLSITFAIKKDSKVAAYITLVGGYILPYITGNWYDVNFILIYYLVISLGLGFISYYKKWIDIRFVSFILTWIFLYGNYNLLKKNISLSLFFLCILFLLYHFSSIITTIKKLEDIHPLDIIIFVSSSVVFLPLFNMLLDIDTKIMGINVMLVSFIYLGELFYFQNKNLPLSLRGSILSAGIVVLNIGFLMLISKIDMRFWLIPFLIQWIIYTLYSKDSENSSIYIVFSYIFFGLSIIWCYMNVIEPSVELGFSTYFTIVFGIVVFFMFYFQERDIEPNFYGPAMIIGGFLFLFIFSKYLGLFFQSDYFVQIILSIFWLCYTLILIKKIKIDGVKTIIYILLGITVIKIAFVDLLFLKGAYRIIGFLIFGLLLLLGGYYIKK
jgi:hypothetical protein